MHPVAQALVGYFERARRRPIVVASHPRSGTHLLIDSLRLNFPACRSWKHLGENLHRLYLNLDELNRLDPSDAVAIASRCERPVLKTHALADFSAASLTAGPCPCDPELVAWLRGNSAGFLYVYRDPREVMKSLHAFVRAPSPDAGGGGRSGPVAPTLGAFIRQQEHAMSRPALWARHVTGWAADASVHCVAMETLLRRPDIALSSIAERLGLEPDAGDASGDGNAPRPLLGPAGWRLPPKPHTLLRLRLDRLFKRHPASTAIGPGQTALAPWQSLLARPDREFFRDEVGDLLIKLGYEESDDWTDPANDNKPKYPAGFWASPAAQGGPPQGKHQPRSTWRENPNRDAPAVARRLGMQR